MFTFAVFPIAFVKIIEINIHSLSYYRFTLLQHQLREARR